MIGLPARTASMAYKTRKAGNRKANQQPGKSIPEFFEKAWYRYAIQNEFETLSTGWYPNPMLMHYANGIRMAYSDELYDWNNCFYDSAQAVKGICASAALFKI